MSNQPVEADFHGKAPVADVRRTDAIFARAKLNSENAQFEAVRVWAISPLGIELVFGAVEDAAGFDVGEPVELQLVIDGRRSEFHGTIVERQNHAEKVGTLVGIRFFSSGKSGLSSRTDMRTSRRWICSENFVPIAVCPSPGKYNEFIVCRVRDISSEGLHLQTSLSHVYLVPGMQLTLSVTLPTVGDVVVTSEVAWMNVGSFGADESLEIGVKLCDPDSKALRMFGQYLLQFSEDVDPDELVKERMIPNNVSLGIRFDVVKRREDYEEVLRIRSKALVGQNLPDSRDRHCRVIVGKLGGRTVVSARVFYPQAVDSLGFEDHLEWTDQNPRRDLLVEVDQIVFDVDGDLKQDMFLAVLKNVCTSCASQSRPFVVLNVDTKLRELSEKVGWRFVGEVNQNSVLVGDLRSAISGKRTNPFVWNVVWSELADYLIDRGEFQPVGTERFLLRFYKFLAVPARLYNKIRFLGRSG